MRIICGLVMAVFLCGVSQARTFSFHEMKNYQKRHSTWKLSSVPKSQHYGILDCQSFFHKWDIYSENEGVISQNHLSVELCSAAQEFFRNCIKEFGELCVDTDDIYKSECGCKEK